MIRLELYFKSSRILLDGYRKETLLLNDWGGCAVGHLIAVNSGFELNLSKSMGYLHSYWSHRGKSVSALQWGTVLQGSTQKKINLRYTIGDERYKFNEALLESTGYSKRELCSIMKAFDSCYPSVFNIRQGLEAAVLKLRKIHNVGFVGYSRDVQKRLVRQNRGIQQKSEHYKWLSNMFREYTYPRSLLFHAIYRERLYWCVRAANHIGMIANRVRVNIKNLLCHHLRSSVSILNESCINQHLSIPNKPRLRHETIASYYRFGCIDNSSCSKWSRRPTPVRYHADTQYAYPAITLSGRSSMCSIPV